MSVFSFALIHVLVLILALVLAGDGSPQRRGHHGPVLRGEKGRRRGASLSRRLRGRGIRTADGVPLGKGGPVANRAVRAHQGRTRRFPRGGGGGCGQ